MDKRLGFVGIIVEDRKNAAPKVNEVLTEYGDMILARTGIPCAEKKCSIITLVVNADTDVLGAMTGKLGKINSVSVKSALQKGKE
ncbi:MAG TPA: iron-only hydrogenase system regulator [Candidatus Omnitrophota bacterium]|nr:iron-only hydrogenase system regulator [Candidatus Omnitrophota bacterium]